MYIVKEGDNLLSIAKKKNWVVIQKYVEDWFVGINFKVQLFIRDKY